MAQPMMERLPRTRPRPHAAVGHCFSGDPAVRQAEAISAQVLHNAISRASGVAYLSSTSLPNTFCGALRPRRVWRDLEGRQFRDFLYLGSAEDRRLFPFAENVNNSPSMGRLPH